MFGSSIPVLVFTIAILDSTKVFRLARALGMNIAVLDYVEVARMRGGGSVVENHPLGDSAQRCSAPLVSEFGLRFCFNFLFVAALSYLGHRRAAALRRLGRHGARQCGRLDQFRVATAPLYTAIAIAMLTVGVNLVVDWLLSIEARGRRGRAGAEM